MERIVRQLRILMSTTERDSRQVFMTRFLALMGRILDVLEETLYMNLGEREGLYARLLHDVSVLTETLYECEMTINEIQGFNRQL